jgi:hypothetical protein
MSKPSNHMVDTILNRITDNFEKGDDGELLLTCPLDKETMYDIYGGTKPDTFRVIINDDPSYGEKLDNLENEDAAKRRIAELMAEKIILSGKVMQSARTQGIPLS